MKRLLLAALLLVPLVARAQVIGGGGGVTVGAPISGSCINGYVLYSNAGNVGCEAAPAASLSVGSPISGGASGKLLFDSSNALGETTTAAGVLTAIGNTLNATGGLLTYGIIGTSGAAVGLLSGNLTFSGNDTFSGSTLTYSGLSAGTQVSCLGLDASNHLVLLASACGSGGGGLTVGTTTITSGTTTKVLFDNGAVLGEYTISGSGNVAMTTSPTFTTPVLGTPTSGTLTNATGLPISTGLTGAGTGVLTALGVNVGSAGAFVVNGGVLGTPSSGTLTNASGLPISGIASLGTGVGTALGNAVNASGGLTTFGTDLPLAGGTLTGELVTVASATGGAGLNLPQGVAPTSPTNGDLWTTASGLFVRIAGSTVGPFAAATGCTVSGSQFQILAVNSAGTGCTADTNASVNAGALSLGASGTAGSTVFGNTTSGTVTLQPVTGALGSVTASLPANTGTLAEINLAQTWTAAQTFTNSDLLLLGSSTGATTFTSDNSSGTNYTVHVPAANDTITLNAATQTLTNKTISTASNTITQATNVVQGIMNGDGQTVTCTAGACSTTLANRGTASSFTILSTDMGGQVNFTGSTGSQTVTIPAISSTVLAAGMEVTVCNQASVALTISSTPTINGYTGSTLPAVANGSAMCLSLTSNGTSLDAIPVLNQMAIASQITGLGTNVATALGVTLNTGAGALVSQAANLTANLPLIGGGSGAGINVGTRSGNTTEFGTVSGSLVSGNCLKSDASGNIVDNAAVCGGATGANPTATASDTAVNGSASTFMRSDGAPAIQKTSASVFGLAKVDGTTITASGGVITAVGGAATTITPGTTTIVGGTAPCAIVNSATTTMACDALGTGVVTALAANTNGSGGLLTQPGLTSGLIPKSGGATSALVTSSITDNGTTVSTTEPFTTSSSTASTSSSTGAITDSGGLGVSGAIWAGTYIAASGTTLPTQAAGTINFGGNATTPTMSSNGEGAIYLLSTTGGLALMGKGSTNDITVENAGGTSTCTVATGTTNWNCTGLQLGGATVATLSATDQVISGGFNLTPYSIGSVSSGTTTIDCGKNPAQWFVNAGASTLAAPTTDGQCTVRMITGSGVGAITFSGFREGSNTGDTMPAADNSSATVTFTGSASPTVNWTNTLAAGDPVYFTNAGGGLPAALTAGTIYYVLSANLSGSVINVAATPGGTAINMATAGTGTQTGHASSIADITITRIQGRSHYLVSALQ